MDIKEEIELKRKYTLWSEEEYESDQQQKKPQPPLVKEASSDKLIDLPRNFNDLPLQTDFVKILYQRRSNRVYTGESMNLLTLSFLMWSQQGIKSIRGNNYATLRTVPSAGARHPFELYVLVLNVENLQPGLYHYLPMTHQLEQIELIDVSSLKTKLSQSILDQSWGLKGNVVFYYSLVPYRGEWRYSINAHRVMMIDLGHISENLYLTATALGLGCCGLGAIDCDLSSELFHLDQQQEYMVYAAPVGHINEKNENAEQDFYAFLKEQ